MRIMFMAQCYAPEDVSAAVLITELATDLVRQGHQVDIHHRRAELSAWDACSRAIATGLPGRVAGRSAGGPHVELYLA